MSLIYKPAGKAGEYAKYGLNVYNGCDFGCTYCNIPKLLGVERLDFHSNISERDNFLIRLEEECKGRKGQTEPVLLSFACDPYGSLNDKTNLTRRVLELFKKYNINFTILTKSGMKASKDFDLYKVGDTFASTLTFIDEIKSKEWEPNASLPKDRIEAIKNAHSLGIATWVSLEPVIDINESLKIIEETYEFVDLFKVGTLNYHELAKTIDWKDFGLKAIKLLESYNKEYYIKNDLRVYLEEGV